MFQSSKIQNGGWIQDGGENVFFILIFQKWLFKKKHSFCFVFWLKNFCATIFWIKIQNGEWIKMVNFFTIFLISSTFFFFVLFTFNYFFTFIDFLLQNNKTNVAKHEIYKQRPNSRWMPKRVLSFKTCKFNYFFKFLQTCLNLANRPSFTKDFFS
jgi:hypothetical protein